MSPSSQFYQILHPCPSIYTPEQVLFKHPGGSADARLAARVQRVQLDLGGDHKSGHLHVGRRTCAAATVNHVSLECICGSIEMGKWVKVISCHYKSFNFISYLYICKIRDVWKKILQGL